MSKNNKTYPMVEVLWIDAEEHGEVGWNDLKEQLKYAKKPCPVMRSVGYVLHNDKNHITLASTIGSKECSTTEKIPTSFIKSITKLSPEIQVEQPTKKKGK